MSRAMKDSGVPWLKEIPVNWKVERGKNVLALQKRPVRDNDEVVTCFRDGEVILRSLRRTEGFTMSDKEIGYQGINEGDIVIHGMDGFAGAMGVSKSTGKGSPVLIVCTPKYDAIPQYIIYYLRALAMTDVFVALATGIRERSCDLRWNKVSELEFIMPSSSEQQAIVEFLDRKCAEVDEMIALQEQIIEELKAHKQSVITEAVTKGLNPDVPMKDSGIEWIDTIPISWKVAKIKNVISLLTDYDANGSFADIASNVKVNLGVPYAWMVRATDLANQRYGLVDGNNYCDISTFNYLKKSVVHSGDVLIAKRGEIGKVYLVPNVDCPMTLAPNTYLLKLRQRVIDNRYFHYFLTSEMGRMQLVLNNKSTAIGAIYKDDVKSISILLPSLREQQDIANHLDTKCTEIDNLISIKQSKIGSLKEYKKSIIYEYVTGKREVE